MSTEDKAPDLSSLFKPFNYDAAPSYDEDGNPSSASSSSSSSHDLTKHVAPVIPSSYLAASPYSNPPPIAPSYAPTPTSLKYPNLFSVMDNLNDSVAVEERLRKDKSLLRRICLGGSSDDDDDESEGLFSERVINYLYHIFNRNYNH